MTWLDNRAALKTLDLAHRLVSSNRAANPHKAASPRIVMLGGDHTTTLSALRSTYQHWGKVSVIHFDSHIGTCPSSQLQVLITKLSSTNIESGLR